MAIEIADYDPKWRELFESEATRLRRTLGSVAVRVEHVGSTAVPGLAAKPVIDIQVAVVDPRVLELYRPALESIGYTYTTRPFPYFHRPDDWPHTHHVHVREAGGVDARRTVAFRDWLRAHPADRQAYEMLKRGLASVADAESVEGRSRYSEAKTDLIRAIERRAQAEASQTSR